MKCDSIQTLVEDRPGYSEMFERLRNLHPGGKALVVSCGPSLNAVSKEQIQLLVKDRIVICIKQAVEVVGEECDIHVNSFCRYAEADIKGLRILLKWLSSHDKGVNLQRQKDHHLVFSVDTKRNSCKLCNSLSPEEFDSIYRLQPTRTCFGPGVMHEGVFPLLIHLGITDVTTVGWDMATYGDGEGHFYRRGKVAAAPYREELDILQAHDRYSEYLSTKDMRVNIISDINILPTNRVFTKQTINEYFK